MSSTIPNTIFIVYFIINWIEQHLETSPDFFALSSIKQIQTRGIWDHFLGSHTIQVLCKHQPHASISLKLDSEVVLIQKYQTSLLIGMKSAIPIKKGPATTSRYIRASRSPPLRFTSLGLGPLDSSNRDGSNELSTVPGS